MPNDNTAPPATPGEPKHTERRAADFGKRFAPEAALPDFAFSKDAFVAWLNEHGIRIPSWARVMVAAAVALAATVALTAVGAALCSAIVAGAMTLTASAFLLNVAWMLGALISIYFGGKIVLGLARYILGGRIDDDLAATRNHVAWAMTPDPKPVRR